MSLYRLIRLAKKTGDRLIIHNETDSSNIVIMDLDNYERLVDFTDPEDFGFGSDFGGDVPPWKPTPEPWDGPSPVDGRYPWEEETEENCLEEMDPMDQEEDDWSHIGEIMNQRYAGIVPETEEAVPIIDEVPPFTPEDTDFEEVVPVSEPIQVPAEPVEPVYESTTPSQPVIESNSVPSPVGAALSWQEEALPGDPVFYEEPT